MSDALEGLRRMMLIRAFETALAGQPNAGFQLLSSGEEAVAVGLCAALRIDDQLLTGGRAIGPALARGVDPGPLMAELLGRSAGLNGGRAGRGHVADPKSGFFGAHAVVGGNIGVAAGVALARKMSGAEGLVAILFGDGAAGAGILHETLNIAALWRLPLLFVCNNNQVSVSTTRSAALAPALLSDLGSAFGLWARTVDGCDLEAVTAAASEAARHIRQGGGPAFLECVSVRLRSHSNAAREIRGREALAALWRLCPIRRQIESLGLGPAEIESLRQDAESQAAQAIRFAEASPYPDVAGVLDHVS